MLHLADNYISRLEGLEGLGRLRHLNVAANDIRHLPDSLLALTGLTALNLAANRIASFKELRLLARMPRLADLALSDPDYGSCPVAALANYQTFMLTLMPRLAVLDSLLLAEEAKALADATYLKKAMYYNMRVKTLHRYIINITCYYYYLLVLPPSPASMRSALGPAVAAAAAPGAQC